MPRIACSVLEAMAATSTKHRHEIRDTAKAKDVLHGEEGRMSLVVQVGAVLADATYSKDPMLQGAALLVTPSHVLPVCDSVVVCAGLGCYGDGAGK